MSPVVGVPPLRVWRSHWEPSVGAVELVRPPASATQPAPEITRNVIVFGSEALPTLSVAR